MSAAHCHKDQECIIWSHRNYVICFLQRKLILRIQLYDNNANSQISFRREFLIGHGILHNFNDRG